MHTGGAVVLLHTRGLVPGAPQVPHLDPVTQRSGDEEVIPRLGVTHPTAALNITTDNNDNDNNEYDDNDNGDEEDITKSS